MTIKLVSWNIAKRRKAWEWLLDMDADVAILQEVGVVPGWVASREGVAIGPREHWDSHVWLAYFVAVSVNTNGIRSSANGNRQSPSSPRTIPGN